MPDIKCSDFAAFTRETGGPAAGIVPAAGNPPEPDYFVTASRIRASADP
jgi:hypothetical protein